VDKVYAQPGRLGQEFALEFYFSLPVLYFQEGYSTIHIRNTYSKGQKSFFLGVSERESETAKSSTFSIG
jgi:hypothetical protein